jgi:two-component system, NarL family, sensor histidine kinase EvgS
MNIERKIGFKAAGLYIFTGIIVALVSIYIYDLRKEIQEQREEIENQHAIFSLTNDFILAVGEVQLFGSKYIATNNTRYIEQLDNKILDIDSLINILSIKQYSGIDELNQIRKLLSKQAVNIYTLNRRFGGENPLADIQKRLLDYKPPVKESVSVVTIKQDTIIKTSQKRTFFRRLKDVFSPDEDSTILITNQRVDTLKLQQTDTLRILSDVDTIAQKASRYYEEQIRAIEQQVSALINADREIASQIAALLIRLHEQTLVSVLDAISESEKSINKNYTISIIGGIVALTLILLFIMLIIYDVNKGKQAREKLRQVMDSRHQLLLSVSHDIKSPLSSILAYLEMRTKDEDVRTMQYSAKHILAMLENLLEYSSLEQGTLQLTLSDVDIFKMGNETAEMFKPLAEAKGLSLQHRADQVCVRTDAMKIKQIIINLISNAIKYTAKGGVEVELAYKDGFLIISINDTGAGIPDDKLNDIFKPFTRVESNNALAHGSGFGMYVVKGLTDLLGGSIRIESKVGKGTLVEISVPVEMSTINIRRGSRKIAVFEDDKLMDELVREMLKQLGHQVVEQDYDIILTDMEMGEISGLDILAKAGDTPVVLMTGRGDYTSEKAREHGFAGFISKPFTIDNLRTVFGEGNDSAEDSFLIEDDEEIMSLFRTSTAENKALLQEALDADDFAKAQSICHKMTPMFAMLGYPTDELRRMDAHRGEIYEGWQRDVKSILLIKV